MGFRIILYTCRYFYTKVKCLLYLAYIYIDVNNGSYFDSINYTSLLGTSAAQSLLVFDVIMTCVFYPGWCTLFASVLDATLADVIQFECVNITPF